MMKNLMLRSLTRSIRAPSKEVVTIPRPLPLLRSHRRDFSSVSKNSNGDDEPYKDLFRVLGLPREFAVNESELKERYKELMREVHPDKHQHKFGDKGSADLEALEEQASAVTLAYNTLQRPHTRATHLLELLGHGMEETASGEDLVGMAFLMEILELREAMESNDLDDDQRRVLLHDAQQRTQEASEQLVEALEQGDMTKAREITAQLQYWHRLEETIRAQMDTLD